MKREINLGPSPWEWHAPRVTRRTYVLLDRDGVINVDRAESVIREDQFEFELGALDALAEFNARHSGTIVITNQAAVGRGELSLEALSEIHEHMARATLEAGGYIDAIYCCTHTDADQCACRKPKPGLIEQAARHYTFERDKTWFVGDDLRDLEAARAARVRPALVLTGKGRGHAETATQFNSLQHFALSLGVAA